MKKMYSVDINIVCLVRRFVREIADPRREIYAAMIKRISRESISKITNVGCGRVTRYNESFCRVI